MKKLMRDPELKKQEILSTAQKLFETHGYENTSVEQIIRELDISKGAFYHYFESKKDLLILLVEQFSSAMENIFKSIVETENLNALEKLKLLIRGPEKEAKVADPLMAIIHKPDNRELQERLTICVIKKLAPLIAKVLEQGNQERLFHAETPLQTAQLLMASSQFLLESDLFDWESQEKLELLKALQTMLERSIKAEEGSMSFIVKRS